MRNMDPYGKPVKQFSIVGNVEVIFKCHLSEGSTIADYVLCAGVYCDSCCELSELTDTFQSADNEPVRACGGCKRGEAPGQSIKDFIRKKLESAEKKEKAADASAMEKIQKRVVAAIGDNLGVKFSCRPPSVAVLLSHGRRYSSEDEVLSDGSELPISGYFEFTNKSDVFCCLKVLLTGGDKKFEIPRPSYCAGKQA